MSSIPTTYLHWMLMQSSIKPQTGKGDQLEPLFRFSFIRTFGVHLKKECILDRFGNRSWLSHRSAHACAFSGKQPTSKLNWKLVAGRFEPCQRLGQVWGVCWHCWGPCFELCFINGFVLTCNWFPARLSWVTVMPTPFFRSPTKIKLQWFSCFSKKP